MRRATIFVLSDVRSGSTLLDQCLGGHPAIVSLGEVHWLAAYLAQDRNVYDPEHPLVCSCGLPVGDCPFWESVQRALGRPLDSLRLRHDLKRSRRGSRQIAAFKHIPQRLIKTQPRLYRYSAVRSLFPGRRLARDCIALYDAVSATTGRPFSVDSSKSPYRFRDVYGFDPGRTVAIALSRDYRAVVHSRIRHGQSMHMAALGWRRRMRQIMVLTKDLPADRVMRLTYETFCEDPRAALNRICSFLGIEFAESMLQRATENVHHIGGSPSKFDPGRIQIALDRSHVGQFSATELRTIQRLVGDAAAEWGY
jgi:hypothetical protein